MISRLSAEDEAKFRGWVDRLALRISAAVLPKDVERKMVDHLRDPYMRDETLSLANAYVLDERLKRDFVKAMMVLDGTVVLLQVDVDGEPRSVGAAA